MIDTIYAGLQVFGEFAWCTVLVLVAIFFIKLLKTESKEEKEGK